LIILWDPSLERASSIRMETCGSEFACLSTSRAFCDRRPCRFHRSITRPYFSKERISDFDIFSKYADKVIGLMKSRVQDGFPVDFQVRRPAFKFSNISFHTVLSQDAMLRFTLDSASEFVSPRSSQPN